MTETVCDKMTGLSCSQHISDTNSVWQNDRSLLQPTYDKWQRQHVTEWQVSPAATIGQWQRQCVTEWQVSPAANIRVHVYIDTVQSSDKLQYGEVVALLCMTAPESILDVQCINILDCLFVVRHDLSKGESGQ